MLITNQQNKLPPRKLLELYMNRYYPDIEHHYKSYRESLNKQIICRAFGEFDYIGTDYYIKHTDLIKYHRKLKLNKIII